jgi:hypothetical protein
LGEVTISQRCRASNPVGVSLLAIGCEAVVKKLDSPSQESRSDFIASKVERHPGYYYRKAFQFK